MEKEDAQAQLRRGIKMKEGDIDVYCYVPEPFY